MERSLGNRVGCVVTWVTWVRGLRGSMGAWVTWVKYFCVGPIFFAWVFACVKIFYVGPKLLGGSIFFYLGQLLFTRRDYFTILQLIG